MGFYEIGVSLGFLQQMLNEPDFDPHYATHQVVSCCVLPFLRAHPECSQDTYVHGHLRPWPENPAFSRATVFVSHAWRCNFGALVSALEHRESERKANAGREAVALAPDFFWLDVFSKDQFAVNSGHTMAQLKTVVESCGRRRYGTLWARAPLGASSRGIAAVGLHAHGGRAPR